MLKEKHIFNQRVLYSGLNRLALDRATLKDAFIFSQTAIAQDEFDIIEVVGTLVKYLDLETNEKKTLMVTLHTSVGKLIEDLPELPGFLSSELQTNNVIIQPLNRTSTQALEQQVTVNSSPHKVVTEHYFTVFLSQLGKTFPEDQADIKREMAKAGLENTKTTHNQTIIKWAKQGLIDLSLDRDISERECLDLAHELYLLAVDFIGPMTADAVMVIAIDACLGLDESARFNPRNFS